MAKDASNFYTATKVIEGVEYVAQFSGLSTALRSVDESYIDGSNNTSVMAASNFILKHAIVDPPGLTVDDFEDMDTLNKVIAFGRDVMQGRFRKEKIEKRTAKSSEK